MPPEPEDEVEHRTEAVVWLEVDAGEAVQLGAQARLFQKLPLSGLVGSFARDRRSARQLPVQAAVGVTDQEDSTSVVEDRAGSTNRGSADGRSLIAHSVSVAAFVYGP